MEKDRFPLEEEAPDKQNLKGSETILVVENERGIRSMISLSLKMHGYNVLQAEDAESALRIFTERKNDIQLVLTDVIMPGLSGVEMIQKLKKIDGRTKVLYMSGYTKGKIESGNSLPEDTHFIQKPFTAQDIIQKIRKTLD